MLELLKLQIFIYFTQQKCYTGSSVYVYSRYFIWIDGSNKENTYNSHPRKINYSFSRKSTNGVKRNHLGDKQNKQVLRNQGSLKRVSKPSSSQWATILIDMQLVCLQGIHLVSCSCGNGKLKPTSSNKLSQLTEASDNFNIYLLAVN